MEEEKRFRLLIHTDPTTSRKAQLFLDLITAIAEVLGFDITAFLAELEEDDDETIE